MNLSGCSRPRAHKASVKGFSHGFAILTALIFLLALGIIAVEVMQGSLFMQKIASNYRARERVLANAQAALKEAEDSVLAAAGSLSFPQTAGCQKGYCFPDTSMANWDKDALWQTNSIAAKTTDSSVSSSNTPCPGNASACYMIELLSQAASPSIVVSTGDRYRPDLSAGGGTYRITALAAEGTGTGAQEKHRSQVKVQSMFGPPS